MKMDSFRTATSPTTTKLDFNAMFDKICNLTSLASPMTVMQPPPPQPPPPPVHVISPVTSRRMMNVSPRILKRGESQPTAMGGPPPTAHQRRLRFQQFSQNSEDVIEVIGADTPMTSMHSVFFGFIHNPATVNGTSSSNSDNNGYTNASSVFTREDYCLENAVAECNAIRGRDGFREGVLLKCIDSKPMFAYLHYSIFTQGTTTRLQSLIRDLDPGPKSQYGAFEELFAVQKSASSPDNSLPSHRHAGFIVSCFKLLDENSKSHNLEKSWLSWTGAREIYKYSPRNWNLRRITLHRHAMGNSKNRTFAYVLMCEFGNILHPSNTIQALDMCERLRARNCGHIALYQVQCNYGHAPSYSLPSHHGPTEGQRKHSTASSSSNHGHNARGWGSPSASRSSPKSPTPQRRVQRNPMLRGYSQDVESTQETSRRRSALLRIRDNSFGFEHDEMDLTGGRAPGPSSTMRYGGYPQFEDMS